MLRTKQALGLRIHRRTLYKLRDTGRTAAVSRGFYRLAELPPLGNPDLVAACSAIPKGVICLVSALAFHGITTQVPHQVDLAIEQKVKRPRVAYPPIRVFWFSGGAFTKGVEKHILDGVPVRVYSPAKTVADCFKYRNKIGLDIALEALRLCRKEKKASVDELMKFGRICRVASIMRPYLEAML
ncbi:MAG: transcriptional regulator [Phycisphaerae bacterium]|nr:transcriptional regulator [Phycisphaerae bacterium]